MRYPFRPMLYKPVSRLGVNLEDWPWLFAGVFLAYWFTSFAGIRWRSIPLETLAAFGAFFVLLCFFNWTRFNRPRYFLRDLVLSFVRQKYFHAGAIVRQLRPFLRTGGEGRA